MTDAPASLRERKRLDTWAALHDAAAELALVADNLGDVTIEAIAERADVSPRTFFNYFGTKEDAVLGFSEPAVPDETHAAFLASADDLLSRVARLFFDVAIASVQGAGSRERRFQLFRRLPELTRRQFAHMAHIEQLVGEIVTEHLAESSGDEDSDESIAETAQMLVLVGGVATRHAVRNLTTKPDPEFDRIALERSISLLRTATGKDV